MKILIYTAIFGGYDRLWEQYEYPGVDYIRFTDREIKESQCWQVRVLESEHEHPRMAAKEFKCCPHRFISRDTYSHAIWIDGSITLRHPDFVKVCLDSLSKWGIGMLRHPFRDCIYEEAKVSYPISKYHDERVIEQALHYRVQGYPPHHGLPAATIVTWDLTRPIVQRIGEGWFYENLLWTYQDQISFPYVLWNNDYWYDTIPMQLYDERYFAWKEHVDISK